MINHYKQKMIFSERSITVENVPSPLVAISNFLLETTHKVEYQCIFTVSKFDNRQGLKT